MLSKCKALYCNTQNIDSVVLYYIRTVRMCRSLNLPQQRRVQPHSNLGLTCVDALNAHMHVIYAKFNYSIGGGWRFIEIRVDVGLCFRCYGSTDVYVALIAKTFAFGTDTIYKIPIDLNIFMDILK